MLGRPKSMDLGIRDSANWHQLDEDEAFELAHALAYELALKAYRL
jgi:hypothetical protein